MSDYIPISRVFITYNPSTAELNTPTYQGVLIGEMNDLHVVANSADDNGHFTPLIEETLIPDRAFDGTLPTELSVDLSEYPLLKPNFSVDYNNVDLFATHSDFVAMSRFEDSLGTAPKATMIPMSKNSFLMYEDTAGVYGADLTQLVSGTEYSSVVASDGIVQTITIVSKASDTISPKVIPGSYCALVTLQDNDTPASSTYDIMVSDRSPITGEVTLGVLKVYYWHTGAWNTTPEIAIPTGVDQTVTLRAGSSILRYTSGIGFKIILVTKSTITTLSSDIDIAVFKIDDTKVIKGGREVQNHVLDGLESGDIISFSGGITMNALTSLPAAAKDYLFDADLTNQVNTGDFFGALHTASVHDAFTHVIATTSGSVISGTVQDVDPASGLVTISLENFFSYDGVQPVIPLSRFSVLYREGDEDNRIIGASVAGVGAPVEGLVTTDDTQDALFNNAIVRGFSRGLTTDLLKDDAIKTSRDGTVLRASVQLAYTAANRDPRFYHNIIEVTPANADSIVGKEDPRNPMGFAYHKSYAISRKNMMYAMITDLDDDELAVALGILSNNTDIMHAYLITDDYNPMFDLWLKTEADPDNSRFKIGFNPTKLVDVKTLYTNENVIAYLSALANDNYTLELSTSTNPLNFENDIKAGTVITMTDSAGATHVMTAIEMTPTSIVFVEQNNTGSAIPAITIVEIDATYKMGTQEMTDYMYTLQGSDTNYLVKILSGTIDYTYEYGDSGEDVTTELSNMYSGILAYSIAISTYAHKPATFVVFDGFGYGRVNGTTGKFSRAQFTTLVSAGYYVYTSTIDTVRPYCLRDATCGLKHGTSLNGTLSKLRPVIKYAKDIFYITKQYLGQYNVVDDVIMMLQMRLTALRKRYISNKIKFLGTLLAVATPAKFTKIPNGLRIEYNVSPQDPLITVNNYITVTDVTKGE